MILPLIFGIFIKEFVFTEKVNHSDGIGKEDIMARGRKRPTPNIKICIGISLLVAVLVFIITKRNNLLNTLNTQFTDTVYQTESVSTLPISIVQIDEKTIQEYGQPSTWSRELYAKMIEKLNTDEHRPAVIVFDIMFTGHKDAEGDAALVEAASKYGNTVVGINAITSKHVTGNSLETQVDSITFPYEELKDVVSCGLVNCEPDRYDYITTAFTGIWYENVWYDSLSVKTLKKFTEFVDANPTYKAMHPEYASIQIPDYSEKKYVKYRFSYTSGPGDFDSISMYDLLQDGQDTARFANNIVLVGAYASGLQDDFKILIKNDNDASRMYGVEIHANIMEAVYEGRLQTDANANVLAWIYAIVSGLLCFALLHTSIVKGLCLCAGTLIVHFVSSLILYKNGIYVMLLYMTLTCVLLMIGIVVYHYLAARYERQKINHAFRMYVAPEIVDDVAGSGTYELQLGGRHKDIAVLFVDIRGFTTMSENLTPEEVVDILNEYFGVITDAIFKNKGTLDKFIGDAAMAVFNSPFDLDDYVYRAVMTACDIARASDALAEKLMEKFGKKVSYGIGVNCGEAIIGNIGSNFRMDYTAIGDTVNTASRLESNAKAGEILISEEVKKRLEGRIETEDVGEIPLKGKSHKIFVYRVKL